MSDDILLIFLGTFIVFVFILRIIFRKRAKSVFKNHPKKTDFCHALSVFDTLYKNIHAYDASLFAREKMGFQEDSFIYGEIDCVAFVKNLESVKPLPGEIFYDLGSGAGKAVFAASLFFHLDARGVELLSELHQLANTTYAKYQQLQSSRVQVQFIHADILNFPFNDADIVFINATCFHYVLWEKIVLQLKQLKVGARIIVISKKIIDAQFRLMNAGLTEMSWGCAGLSIYIKEKELEVEQDRV